MSFDVFVFLDNASPSTLASVIYDIQAMGTGAKSAQIDMERQARAALVAHVGSDEADRLIEAAAGKAVDAALSSPGRMTPAAILAEHILKAQHAAGFLVSDLADAYRTAAGGPTNRPPADNALSAYLGEALATARQLETKLLALDAAPTVARNADPPELRRWKAANPGKELPE